MFWVISSYVKQKQLCKWESSREPPYWSNDNSIEVNRWKILLQYAYSGNYQAVLRVPAGGSVLKGYHELRAGGETWALTFSCFLELRLPRKKKKKTPQVSVTLRLVSRVLKSWFSFCQIFYCFYGRDNFWKSLLFHFQLENWQFLIKWNQIMAGVEGWMCFLDPLPFWLTN